MRNNLPKSEILVNILRIGSELIDDELKKETAEGFLLGVIDIIEDGVAFPEDSEYTKTKEKFLSFDLDIERAKKRLEYFLSRTFNLVMSGAHFKLIYSKASQSAKSRGMTEVTADFLIDYIFMAKLDSVERMLRTCKKGYFDDVDEIDEDDDLDYDINIVYDDDGEVVDIYNTVSDDDPQAEKKVIEKKKDKSDIARLSREVSDLRHKLSEKILGQEKATDVFASGYFQAELSKIVNPVKKGPLATFLFAGPPGVGKTFMAETAAELLNLSFARFDMSEYCDKEAVVEFLGSDKVYTNGKRGNFTSFIEENPNSIVLFDEIEKAHISIIHQFLQMLDAGRIRDNYTDNVLSLENVIMIFTTNAGHMLYENSENGNFSNLPRKVILNALKNDINPETGTPFFPDAICSRFASGNVVMFNHISAHNLLEIAKRAISDNAKKFEEIFNIKTEIDEKVYASVLLREGAKADARVVKARADAFFNDELYELLRLLDTKSAVFIRRLENIEIKVRLNKELTEITSLFSESGTVSVLALLSPETMALCGNGTEKCKIICAENFEEAKSVLSKEDISFVLIDYSYEYDSLKDCLNFEDMETPARELLQYCLDVYGDIPVYLAANPAYPISVEEKLSFMCRGAKGIIEENDRDSWHKALDSICKRIYQQKILSKLAKANKSVSFETSQSLSDDRKTAYIELFDFKLVTAIDSEDMEDIISGAMVPDVKFDDIIGAEDAKEELKYFGEILKNSKKYSKFGIKQPKGILLYGPPGTGKTMLAKAMAGESGVTFISAEGNQFLKSYLGEGEAAVHKLFAKARKYAPAIIFIDEIDAIAKERKGDMNANTGNILTALLTEMDGFKKDTKKPVFVLAATNFDAVSGGEKGLDGAFLRRFDRRIYVDLPNCDEREIFFKKIADKNILFSVTDSKLKNLASRSVGMSLAEIEQVFEIALRTAVREKMEKITDEILDEAFEVLRGGEKKNWDSAVLLKTARHEAGHALVSFMSGNTPSYLTVVARGNHGGYMQYESEEDKAIYTKEEILDKVRTALAGRAAEIVYYGKKDGISTGASGDLAFATKMAESMICSYGMDEGFGMAVMSDVKSDAVREKVNEILSEELKKAIEIIEDNKKYIDALCDQLLEKNRLSGDEIEKILGKDINGKLD